LKNLETACRAKMEEAYAKSKDLKITQEDWMTEQWAEIKDDDFTHFTGVDEGLLSKIG